MVTETVLRAGRVTRYLPWLRGLEIVRRGYRKVIRRPDGWTLRIDDFDGDLKLDIDPRECVGITVWHKPDIFEKKERDIFCENIHPGTMALDIGANIGVYSLLGAKRGAHVFAIEADPSNAAKLRHHIELNGMEAGVTVFEMAASDKPGSVTIYRNPINSGGSNCFGGSQPVAVQARTIDSLDLPPIEICKMDVEGAEARAIVGMKETISRSPDFKLCVEYNPTLMVGDCSPLADVLHTIFESVHVIGGHKLPEGIRPKGFCDLFCTKVRRGIDWDRAAGFATRMKDPIAQ
jgi:FkbM family methyltransferase